MEMSGLDRQSQQQQQRIPVSSPQYVQPRFQTPRVPPASQARAMSHVQPQFALGAAQQSSESFGSPTGTAMHEASDVGPSTTLSQLAAAVFPIFPRDLHGLRTPSPLQPPLFSSPPQPPTVFSPTQGSPQYYQEQRLQPHASRSHLPWPESRAESSQFEPNMHSGMSCSPCSSTIFAALNLFVLIVIRPISPFHRHPAFAARSRRGTAAIGLVRVKDCTLWCFAAFDAAFAPIAAGVPVCVECALAIVACFGTAAPTASDEK